MTKIHTPTIPLNDATIIAVARLIDDSQEIGHREPSHSAIEAQIDRVGLEESDPNRTQPSKPVGKEKRVRHVLSWALEHDPESGTLLLQRLIAQVRALGGFRQSSENFVGHEPIENLRSILKNEGLTLEPDGTVRQRLLENVEAFEVSAALYSYIRRAKTGADDAALVTGTGKDLLEATAAHVLTKVYGNYSTRANFPTLLGQAFAALNLKTIADDNQAGEPPTARFERALYELGCSINKLRNKEGTGHGRPFLPTIDAKTARIAVESMAMVAEALLEALEKINDKLIDSHRA